MQWLVNHWWIMLLIPVGIIVSAVKDLKRVDLKIYLAAKPKLPPHRDNNTQWDVEDD
jgi:hypothetical protein